LEITFYNRNGIPIAYTEDGEHIFLFSGEPVAYLYGESVFSFTGKHLGWFREGWIRDNFGECVFFTENTQGGPAKPMKCMKPMKSMKLMKSMKAMKEMRPMRPMNKLSWSHFSGTNFFNF